MPQLSEHFHSREFNCRDGTPVPRRDYDGLEVLCKVILEPMRRKYGPVRINSGYRTRAYNARIGGASQSYHVYTIHDGNDQAADIQCARGSVQDWARTLNWLRNHRRGGRGGLGVYPTSGFCHFDLRDYTANWTG